jgi:hypothetical protein
VLTKEESTKSPLEIENTTEENSNHHGEDLGTECSLWEKEKPSVGLFWREKVMGHGSFYRQTVPV